ncbi:oligosaccharide flippase family protein [Vibrio hannami]|uniref:lipopolysaccharide biosynthesis protein n=1 Tax=Vibrio hannami TaxID=2717094 RepID=UPI00240ED704|nr:oligosaccharide flippase family protein [Vibrio hannami]MDG3087040.1 oligosaccharide flippase family protein [Vibrio hannami]
MSLIKSTTTIAGSSVISQLIGAGAIWLISHKYGMAEVGHYALIYSIVLIGAQVCTYATHLLLPKQEDSHLAQNVVYCCLQSALIALPFSCGIAIGFDLSLGFIYVLTLAYGLLLISENLLLRDEKVKILAMQRLSVSIVVICALVITKTEPLFYWVWAVVLLVNAISWLSYSLKQSHFTFGMFSFRSNHAFFVKNKAHITKVGSAEVLAMASANLPTILVNLWFSSLTAGYFAVVTRFCLSPVNIVGNAVRNSIFSSWSLDFRNNRFNLSEYRKTRKLLFILALLAITGIFIFYPLVMNQFFSEEWQSSVPTSRYMLPYMFIALAISPLTVIELVFGDPKYFLRIQIEQLTIVLIAFAALPYWHLDYSTSVMTYALLSFTRYMFIFYRMNRLANNLAKEKSC